MSEAKKPKFLTRFNRPKMAGLDCKEPTLTKQADKEGCDINAIMAKYVATGQLPEMIKSNPQYGDFSSVGSYQDSMNTVLHAQEQFAGLPAAVRKRFANDPMAFLAFATDKENGAELVKMGLASARLDEVVSKAPTTDDPPKGPPKGPQGAQKAKSAPPSSQEDE